MTDPVVVAIQARTGSTRLPGKVLADLAGRPMLRFQLDRLMRLPCDHLVVATTDRSGDDRVVELATAAGVDVIRGPEGDVLARYRRVIDAYRAHTLVRLTGDCPFTDPDIVSDAIALHLKSGADYTSNVHPRSFPHGLDVEVASAQALLDADIEAHDPYEREHVMPFIYRRPQRFRLANLHSGADLGVLRWTVDTAEDLQRVRRIAAMLEDPINASWKEVLAAVRTDEGFSQPDPQ